VSNILVNNKLSDVIRQATTIFTRCSTETQNHRL